MINFPYTYRRSGNNPILSGSPYQTELPAILCGVPQKIWMTARRDTLSGSSGSIAPCLECVTTWSDQSQYGNSATLLNSTQLSADPDYWPDYWTGDTTSNFKPFVSFDRKTGFGNQGNSLNIPYDASFGKKTEFTFSAFFRARQIEPNSVTEPADGTGGAVVLFQHGNDTTAPNRSDGWGIDKVDGLGTKELRIWYYDVSAPTCSDVNLNGNGTYFVVNDWTKWMRLTIRLSGDTLQANLYNLGEFISNSGMTWQNGSCNGSGAEVTYTAGDPNWFIAAQKSTGFPSSGIADHTTLHGSWDIAEYILYDQWLPDDCVNTIWNYYDYRYGMTNHQP